MNGNTYISFNSWPRRERITESRIRVNALTAEVSACVTSPVIRTTSFQFCQLHFLFPRFYILLAGQKYGWFRHSFCTPSGSWAAVEWQAEKPTQLSETQEVNQWPFEMSFHQLISLGKSLLEEVILVALAPIFFWGKARVQVAKSSAAVMRQVNFKQEETTLSLPSPSLVTRTIAAIYSTDLQNMHFCYGNTVFIKWF